MVQLNMGFAEDVEVILEGIGSANKQKTQCLLFSATTPPWVKQIGRQYQENVLSIDSTAKESGARTATTVRHLAVQVPPGPDSKKAILEDIIAVEISKDANLKNAEIDADENPLAAAAASKKRKSNSAMQQKIFGKTIVFTETKREADELVSGGVFKSLTAQVSTTFGEVKECLGHIQCLFSRTICFISVQALHGDVGQKQRDSTLNAFRAGAFNVLVATDVAARGIDIQDVDLVVQFQPPRDVDAYVHRSGRTGRAGNKGTSVLLFSNREARDIVRIERDLGHGFKFELAGPPSTEAALRAAAKTSAMACTGVPEETAKYFKEAASELLAEAENPEDIVAKCLAAISRRSNEVESRSLLTGELGMTTVEMMNSKGRPVSPGDVMYTVSKLSKMSRSQGGSVFESDVGKIQSNSDSGTAIFDMSVSAPWSVL
jgi:ATP-dependent RNA helicase DDX21